MDSLSCIYSWFLRQYFLPSWIRSQDILHLSWSRCKRKKSEPLTSFYFVSWPFKSLRERSCEILTLGLVTGHLTTFVLSFLQPLLKKPFFFKTANKFSLPTHFISDELKEARTYFIIFWLGSVYHTTFPVHKSTSLWILVLAWSSMSYYNAGGNKLLDIKAVLSRKKVLTRREYAGFWVPADL